jgi:outer membrane protein TolC
MRIRFVRLLAVLAAMPVALPAQDTPVAPRQLSLTEAINLARRNSPAYLQALNDEGPAAADVRAAYGSLLPTLSSSGGISYSRAGSQTIANQVFARGSSTLGSSYNLSASLGISYGKFLAPAQSKAFQRVTEENIVAAGVNLVADVTAQYLQVLRAEASVHVAEQQVARNSDFQDQARARFEVGRGDMVEVRQAEVAKTRADVQLLQARQFEREAKIELLRRMGMPVGPDLDGIVLTEQFALTPPTFELAALQRMAREQNPQLRAADAQVDASSLGVRSARSEYLPSFSVSTGISGFTQDATNADPLLQNAFTSAQAQADNCEFQNAILVRLTSPHPSPGGGVIADCNAFAGLNSAGTGLDPALEQQIRDANDNFPFGFRRSPWSISFGVSLPLFDGFSRAARVSQARAQEDDAREQLRAQRLLIDGQVQAQVLAAETAWQSAAMADTNRSAATDQLTLARERYRLGSGTALEVADAQNAVTQAEADYVNAVYDYHAAVVGLEATVGRPLR